MTSRGSKQGEKMVALGMDSDRRMRGRATSLPARPQAELGISTGGTPVLLSFRGSWILAVALVLLIAALPASACRYSVREVGFVGLDEAPYRFLLYPGGAPEDVVARVKRAAYTAFIDCHVRIEQVADGETGVDYIARHELTRFPAGVLVAPEGQSLPVLLPADVLGDDDSLLALFRPLVASPVRDALRDAVVEPFCTLLLIHGDDAKLNVTTKVRTEAAIQELTANMSQLEKGTEVPPRLLELTAANRAGELPLLWCLGLSPADLAQPRVAVLFGRARRMGSVLRGDRVTQDSLVEIMSLIGASCECGLDRKWMQGPMILMDWDNIDQAALANHLGFDPESPMVKTEISQIIAQGMAAKAGAAKMDSILGVYEPASDSAPVSVEVEDVLTRDRGPRGRQDGLVVEDVPLEPVSVAPGDDSNEPANLRETAPSGISVSREGDTVAVDFPNGNVSVQVTSKTPLVFLVLLFVFVNVGIAVILYRKRAQR